MAIGSGAVAAIGTGTFIIAGYRSIQNMRFKTEPNLLFMSKKNKNETVINQAMDLRLMSKMRGYNNGEKAAMMGLQTLVGFSRCKDNLKDTPFELDEDGKKVYLEKFSTTTHSVNLKNLEYLEKLGYIKIDSIDNELEPKGIRRIFDKKPKEKKSLLIAEKLGFGNLKGVADVAKEYTNAVRTGDYSELNKMKTQMKKITFRMTDKPIDFEEIEKFGDKKYRDTMPKDIADSGRKISLIPRILKDKGLKIKKDAFGRDTLKYPSLDERKKLEKDKKTRKQQREATRKTEKKAKEFDEYCKNGVDKEKIIEEDIKTAESLKQKSNEPSEKMEQQNMGERE